MSRMYEAAVHLANRQQEINGEPVTYTRDSVSYTQVNGEPLKLCKVRTRAERSALESGRANLTAEPGDWIALASVFVALGLTEPVDGDRITTASGEIWELGARDGEPAFRKSDQWGYALRLRTTRQYA